MIGIDEVGRGAWAGPLVVGGCYFIENPGFIRGLNDSKKLSARKRLELDNQIKSSTLFYIVEITPKEIDTYGLTYCTRKAIVEIVRHMPTDALIMLDGKFNYLKGTEFETRSQVVIGADGLYVPVMAASIIAKVARDNIMKEYATRFPQYGFEKHVGYGTKFHRAALLNYGVTSIHRLSFKPVSEIGVLV
ncbi:MAG TPA: ribonuclease HII [Candidatus Saccharibacteria bacterium]|jgi:ribonuclease HII|nr:ribonuclease HII [Candidatus Saccharibacteria bacterium]HMT55249.1 ribonuclease HII [Candidatus Saccharibacteria bacterium]